MVNLKKQRSSTSTRAKESAIPSCVVQGGLPLFTGCLEEDFSETGTLALYCCAFSEILRRGMRRASLGAIMLLRE